MTEVVTLVLPLKDSGEFLQVLLGIHQRGLGKGFWNGFGGKLENGETLLRCAVRELEKESGLSAIEEDLDKVALIDFYKDGKHVYICHVYTLREWKGECVDSEEMASIHPHMASHLPKLMWPGDKKWWPIIFEGGRFIGRVDHKSDEKEFSDFKCEFVESL